MQYKWISKSALFFVVVRMMREELKQKARRERSVARRMVEFGGSRKKDVEKVSMVRTTLEWCY